MATSKKMKGTAVVAEAEQSTKIPVEINLDKPIVQPVVTTTATEVLSEAQKAQKAAIEAAGGRAIIEKCTHCGKWLVRDESVERGEGDHCFHLFDELGHTAASLSEHRKSMTADEVPEGWVKVASLHRICVQEGIPVAALVKAFGGDRTLSGPLHPKFNPLYVGNARWLDPWCAGPEGLAFLRSLARQPGKATTKAPAKVKTPAPAKDLESFIADADTAG